MRRITVLAAALISGVAIVLVTLVSSGVVSADPDRIVRTRGDNQLIPNAKIMSTLKFAPGQTVVDSGDTVTWVHADKTEEPHTVTIVNQADLPDSVEEVFVCPVCEAALAAHFGTTPPTLVVDVGSAGLDSPGDSLLFFPGESISATVSAPSGTTLYYLCAIHPWMQGSITVR